MPGRHNITRILEEIDGVLEVATVNTSGSVPVVASTPDSLIARPLAEATGQNVVLVDNPDHLEGEAAAIHAARTALQAFLPGAVLADLERGDK